MRRRRAAAGITIANRISPYAPQDSLFSVVSICKSPLQRIWRPWSRAEVKDGAGSVWFTVGRSIMRLPKPERLMRLDRHKFPTRYFCPTRKLKFGVNIEVEFDDENAATCVSTSLQPR